MELADVFEYDNNLVKMFVSDLVLLSSEIIVSLGFDLRLLLMRTGLPARTPPSPNVNSLP